MYRWRIQYVLEGEIMRIEQSKITPGMWFVRDSSGLIRKVTYEKKKAEEARIRLWRGLDDNEKIESTS